MTDAAAPLRITGLLRSVTKSNQTLTAMIVSARTGYHNHGRPDRIRCCSRAQSHWRETDEPGTHPPARGAVVPDLCRNRVRRNAGYARLVRPAGFDATA